jgi:hypothetical protein
LGWSSGADPSGVLREPVKSATWIKAWPIIEGSLTATPAEYRNGATAKTITDGELNEWNEVEKEVDEPPTIQQEVDLDPLRHEVAEAISAATDQMQQKFVEIVNDADYVSVKAFDELQTAMKAQQEKFASALLQLEEQINSIKSVRELAAEKAVSKASPTTIADLIAQKTEPKRSPDADDNVPEVNSRRYGKHKIGIGV